MTRALVRASGAVASLAFVSFKALAKSGPSVADTTASAFSVAVELSVAIGSIYPCKFERADAV